MSSQDYIKQLIKLSLFFARKPRAGARSLKQLSYISRGFTHSNQWSATKSGATTQSLKDSENVNTKRNPLKSFFNEHKTGRGVWKWEHYLDIYHQYFSRFVGSPINVLEVGVYSGGSLEMWREYFGKNCQLYGVDIEVGCKNFENKYTKVFIGDQSDRRFWGDFKDQTPPFDVIIDDGGHQTEQQIITLEELLPKLRPGGIYVCEDILGEYNGFSSYMYGLISNLNVCRDTSHEFQSWIRSVHFYPYMTVIEKAEQPLQKLSSRSQGTEWLSLISFK